MEHTEVKIDRKKMVKVRCAIMAAADEAEASPFDVMSACSEVIGEMARKAHQLKLTDDSVTLAEQARSKIKSAAIGNAPSEVWKIRK